MSILLVVKYPPIQGGVSAKAYWTAHEMGQRGYQVDVVTNASEADPGTRCFLFGEDESQLQREYSNGCVRVHTTTPLRSESYTPWANPFVSKLYGRALQVAREYGCDVLYSSYLEPYGVVAALLGQALGKPVLLRHAGSDIGRLAKHPDLFECYSWALRQANHVVTAGRAGEVRDLLDSMGIDAQRLYSLPSERLAPPFLKRASPLPIEDLLKQSPQWFFQLGLPEKLAEAVIRNNEKPFPKNACVIGSYGKVGETKGTYDLLEALDQLAQKERDFVFLTLAGGRLTRLKAFYEKVLQRNALAQRTWLLPLLAPWRVPGFIACCNAVCFLERDFPISFHGPKVPREILAAGSCLVCSGEIARKQWFYEDLVDGKNGVFVPDPRDVGELAHRLNQLIVDPQQCSAIAARGHYLSKAVEGSFLCVNKIGDYLEQMVTEKRIETRW